MTQAVASVNIKRESEITHDTDFSQQVFLNAEVCLVLEKQTLKLVRSVGGQLLSEFFGNAGALPSRKLLAYNSLIASRHSLLFWLGISLVLPFFPLSHAPVPCPIQEG